MHAHVYISTLHMPSNAVHIPLSAAGVVMIRSFRSKRLRRYWDANDARGLPRDHLTRLNLRLDLLDQVAAPEGMNVPGWHFHALVGDQHGRYSVRVTGNWRLTFAWDADTDDAIDLDYEDYH
jgi:toxin HigB-1